MRTRRSLRNVAMNVMDVVDLMSSDDDEEMDRKPPAKGKKNDEIVCLLSEDTSSDEEDISFVPRAAAKRRHAPRSDEVEVVDVDNPSGSAGAAFPKKNGRTHAAASPHFDNNDGYSASSSRFKRRAKKAFASMIQDDSITDLDADEELARRLQKEEDARSSSSSRAKLSTSGKTYRDVTDIELARQIQQEDEKTQKVLKFQEKKDAKIAASLHSAEEKERDERKLKELDSMKNSISGRSVLLIEKIIKIIEKHSSTDDLEPVAKDDAVYLAEKMMELQETFKTEGKTGHICIGYHYTKHKFLESIRTDGLLTVDDRIAAKHSNTKNSAVFGNGIYTATNPLGFTHYGDVGLLLAVLKGQEQVLPTNTAPPSSLQPGTDTVIGNKTGDSPFHDEVILKKSSQVLPLVKFKTSEIYKQPFGDMVWSIHQEIQAVLDEYFNESIPTTVRRVTPGTCGARLPAAAPLPVAGGFTAGTGTSFLSMPTTSAGGMPMAFSSIPGLSAMGFGGMMPASMFSLSAPAGAAPVAGVTSATGAAPLPAMGFGGMMPGPMASLSAPTGAAPVAGVTAATLGRRHVRHRRVARPTKSVRRSGQSSTNESITYTAPETMVVSTNTAALLLVSGGRIGSDQCAICICPLAGSDPVVETKCKHLFHETCIKSCLKHDVKCPECRKPMTDSVQGRGPSGIMTVTTSPSDVSGFANTGSIMITYQLHGGVQKAYHPSPGVAYGADARVGYLPNDLQGQDLLKRLKYAFRHGLTFSIGTSLTTHQPNVIVWGSIHHKTSMHGGPHGWPDPNYFANANSELDGAGVPSASQL